MSSRVQRFKVSDVVVVAAHSPIGTPGDRLVVFRTHCDAHTSMTGAAGNSARYSLIPEGSTASQRVIPLELWDWMLEPAKFMNTTPTRLTQRP